MSNHFCKNSFNQITEIAKHYQSCLTYHELNDNTNAKHTEIFIPSFLRILTPKNKKLYLYI